MTNRKRAKTDKKAETGKVTFQGFLDLKLNEQEKDFVSKHPLKPEFHGQLAADMASEGYKVSLSFSPGQDSYILTAYGNRIGHPDAGYALSIWHRDYCRCFDVLAFVREEAGKMGSLTDWLGKEADLDW